MSWQAPGLPETDKMEQSIFQIVHHMRKSKRLISFVGVRPALSSHVKIASV